MGILDAFDSPGFLNQVLGLNMNQGWEADDARNAAAMRVRNSVTRPTGGDFTPPMPPEQGAPAAAPQAAPIARISPPANPSTNPADSAGVADALGPQPAPGIPLPPPRPPGAMNASAQAAPPAPPMPPQAQPAPPMPMAAAPAPRPPASQFAGGSPVVSTSGGGLAGALGINPDTMRASMAGIGKGLSAVGHQPLGASKGQAFAAGAGGSLEGMAEAQQKQKDTLFNQSSTAFKDMMLARDSDDKSGYRAAQSKYLIARAQSLQTMTAGGKASQAYQNTPEFKVLRVEEDASKWEKGQQIMLQKRWTLNGSTPEQQQQDLDNLGKKVEQFKNNLYKQSGIDPKNAEKLRTRGETPENPYDTKGMTLDSFHQLVPMGGWFKDQNGTVRQRTVPPPGSQSQAPQGQPGAQPGASAAANTDDAAAMNEAA